jgi:hypothetical protein
MLLLQPLMALQQTLSLPPLRLLLRVLQLLVTVLLLPTLMPLLLSLLLPPLRLLMLTLQLPLSALLLLALALLLLDPVRLPLRLLRLVLQLPLSALPYSAAPPRFRNSHLAAWPGRLWPGFGGEAASGVHG